MLTDEELTQISEIYVEQLVNRLTPKPWSAESWSGLVKSHSTWISELVARHKDNGHPWKAFSLPIAYKGALLMFALQLPEPQQVDGWLDAEAEAGA